MCIIILCHMQQTVDESCPGGCGAGNPLATPVSLQWRCLCVCASLLGSENTWNSPERPLPGQARAVGRKGRGGRWTLWALQLTNVHRAWEVMPALQDCVPCQRVKSRTLADAPSGSPYLGALSGLSAPVWLKPLSVIPYCTAEVCRCSYE